MRGRVDPTDDRNLTLGSRPPARHRHQRPLPASAVLGLTVAALLGVLGAGAALAPGSITGPGAPGEAPAAQVAGDHAADGGTGGADHATALPASPPPGDPAAGRTADRQPTPGSTRTAKPTKAAPRRPAAPAKPKIGSGQEDQENEVIRLTNVERSKRGCGKVTLNVKLRTAIRGHTQDMADKHYFAHDSLDGRSPWDRAKAAGYPSPIGENIAKGQPSAADVMRSWMNSPGHKANILNCDAKAIGVGLSYDGGTPIWGQLFGSR